MIKALIVDTNISFIDDISRTLMIDERNDIEVYPETNIDNVDRKISNINPNVVVVSAKICDSREWDFGIPVRTYARNAKEIAVANSMNLECYGVVARSTHLLDAIVHDKTLYVGMKEDGTSVLTSDMLSTDFSGQSFQTSYGGFTDVNETNNNQKQQNVYQNNTTHQRPKQSYAQQEQYNQQNYYSSQVQGQTEQQNYAAQQQSYTEQKQNNSTKNTQKQLPYVVESGQGYYDDYGRYVPIYLYYYYDVESNSVKMIPGYYDPDNGTFYKYPYPLLPAPSDNADTEAEKTNDSANNGYSSVLTSDAEQNYTEQDYLEQEYESVPEQSSASSLRNTAIENKAAREKQEEKEAGILAEREFNVDMDKLGKRARCITVYSAKGGVGKTTIACELSTFLALTAHHRGKYKVCVADFNIDFGDVMNTLDFDQHGANMTTWAADIRSRLDRGEKPEDIQYTRDRIMVWLQKNEKDGLYALLAPTSNIDSMAIGEKEINIMINNLLGNCGFDFVICDTGNNTRDSSFIALENADVVLMVLTQTVNAANCNNSFLQTAERVGFDMNKIKLVINRVRPTKSVGISPEELETAFINPKTRKPYRFETLAKIKDSDDVTNSANLGTPLVYNSSHEFTKTMGEIVRKLIGEETVLEEPKKQSLWNKIIGRK